MRKKKNGLDERQEKLVNKIGMRSFMVMFFACAAAIVAQLAWKRNLSAVAGETVVLLAGGVTCLFGTMKNGIWSKSGRRATVGENLLWSVVMSGIFSVLYAAILLLRGGDSRKVAGAALGFFVGIAVAGFVILTILGIVTQKRKEKEEEKYE